MKGNYMAADDRTNERNNINEELQESETRYRTLFEALDAGVLLMRGAECVECNPATLALFGVTSKDEIIGKTPFDFAPAKQPDGSDSAETVRRNAEMALEKGLHVFEWQAFKKSGEPVFLEVRFTPYRIGDEQYFQCIAIDITERKRAEEQLRKSEALLARSQEIAHVGSWVLEIAANQLTWSDEVYRIFGLQPREFGATYESFLDSVHPEDRASVDTAYSGSLRDGRDGYEIEHRIIRKQSGEIRYVHEKCTHGRDDGGQIVRSVGMVQDITERKRTEEALRESAEQFRSLAEQSITGICLIQDDVFMYVNPRLAEILGRRPEEMIGVSPVDLVAETDRVMVREKLRERFSGKVRSAHYTFTALTKSGGHKVLEVHGSITLLKGRPAILATLLDITERKRAEEALRESEERFRNLAESLPLTIFETDLEGRFTYANRAGLEKYGYSQKELDVGLSVFQVISPGDRDRAQEVIARRLAGDLSGYTEYQGLRKDGTTFPITVASSPILRDGRPVGIRGIVTDLSERKQWEEERLKTQKLESVGTLAGGIAHDFNNLLQGIFGYISMARMTIDRKEKSLSMLEQAEKALHHSVNLTNQLLAFSKGGKPVKQTIAPGPVIENAAKFALSGSRINYRIDIRERLLNIEADEGQVAQVIQNIVLNAEQAMPMGGMVIITAGNVHAPGPAIPLQVKEGDYVMISVQDNGVGIPEQYLAKIFDPYFTTKEKGSGLGLATSYAIIRNHGGMITASSEPGKGTTFHIFLPASDRVVKAAAPVAVPGNVRRRRVLVMDDEAVVRKTASNLLRELGHQVKTVEHGAAAIDAYRKMKDCGRPFDIVILDLTVRGGMGGAEAMRKLLEIDPAVAVIVSSGYAENAVTSTFHEHGFKAFLKKPYTVDGLRDVLNSVLK